MEDMRVANVDPDTHTCSQVVSLYMRCGDLAEASHALSVLSARMLKPGMLLGENQDEDEGDSDDNSDGVLEDALFSDEPEANSIYVATLAQMMQGSQGDGQVENSLWATRLREQYVLWNQAPQKTSSQSR